MRLILQIAERSIFVSLCVFVYYFCFILVVSSNPSPRTGDGVVVDVKGVE